MEETLSKEKLVFTGEDLQKYINTHDVKYVAENAVFKNLSTGQEHKGRVEIGAMLHYMYQVAFDAHAEVTNMVVTENKAMFEGFFVGKHIGEIAGVKPTNKDVRVPICVSYEVRDGLIQEARIYMLLSVMMCQLGVTETNLNQKTTFLVRDIFQLKFGHFREAKKLLQEATEKNMMPEAQQTRVLTDFTGDAYRLVFEEGYNNLADYENSLSSSLKTAEWQEWYERFKPHVERSHREILKQIF